MPRMNSPCRRMKWAPAAGVRDVGPKAGLDELLHDRVVAEEGREVERGPLLGAHLPGIRPAAKRVPDAGQIAGRRGGEQRGPARNSPVRTRMNKTE